MTQSHPHAIDGLRRATLAACMAAAFGLHEHHATAGAIPYSAAPPSVTASQPSSAPRTPAVVVANCNDTGAGSLRSAILAAASGDTIDLTQLSCGTITLTTGQIQVDQDNLFIEGPGASALTIEGGTDPSGYNRVFMHLGTGRLTVSYVTISHGSQMLADTSRGGCIFSNGDVRISNAIVDSCIANAGGPGDAHGGGIAALGEVSLFESTVTNCLAYSQNYHSSGGGIDSGSLSSKYSTISDNRSASGSAYYGSGGGFYWEGGGDVYLRSTTVSGNSAMFDYGGLAVRGLSNAYTANVINSTIADNYARQFVGGAAFQIPVTISNSTIAFNDAGHVGAAAGLSINAVVSADLESTLVGLNAANGYPDDLETFAGATITGANNLVVVSGATLPADTIRDCPLLSALADNGGYTRTAALLQGSPGTDAGSNLLGFLYDQRGAPFARVVGANADIGAFENQGNPDDLVFAGDFDPSRCP